MNCAEPFWRVTYPKAPMWSNLYHPPHRLVPRMTMGRAFSLFRNQTREEEKAANDGFTEVNYHPSIICHPDDVEPLERAFERLGCRPEPIPYIYVDMWSYEAYRMVGNGD